MGNVLCFFQIFFALRDENCPRFLVSLIPGPGGCDLSSEVLNSVFLSLPQIPGGKSFLFWKFFVRFPCLRDKRTNGDARWMSEKLPHITVEPLMNIMAVSSYIGIPWSKVLVPAARKTRRAFVRKLSAGILGPVVRKTSDIKLRKIHFARLPELRDTQNRRNVFPFCKAKISANKAKNLP